MHPERIEKKYRADIDGLRAIAVVAVVLYHAKVPGFAGGYVGVDIFFVISGFLITQVLDTSGSASRGRALMDFYLRRARRILPALFVMLAGATLLAVALHLPTELRNFGKSLVLAVPFLGNFAAALNGNYFAPEARFLPLRHLWSLGVEEQFYLFYPLCLLMLTSRRIAVLATIALVSLLLSFWGAEHSPVLNFYMLPTRGWELLVGALVALIPFRTSQRTNEFLAIAGIVGLAAVFWRAQIIQFPGITTIVACLCTALLIITRDTTLVARMLSLRPIVFTGLISYSLYLWHAPILDFYTYYNIHEPSGAELAVLFLVLYVIATASWMFVEQPFRKQKTSFFVPIALAAAVTAVAIGYRLMRVDLPPAPPEPAELFARVAQCSATSTESIAAGQLCSFGPQNDSAKKVVVWGDSHAAVLMPTYQALADADGIRIYFGTHGACWPLVGSERASAGEFWRATCAKFNAAMVQAIERIQPDRIILNAYWLDPGAVTESEFLKRTRGTRAEILEALKRTLEKAQSPPRSACAVLTVPGYEYAIPYAMAMAARRGLDPSTLVITRAEAFSEYQTVEGALRDLAAENRLRVSDPKEALCPGETCSFQAANGELLYRDGNHLSAVGARVVSGVLENCLADLH